MPGGKSDEMASGAYSLVFRDVRAGPFLPGYKPFREEFRWLFNSYYNSIGEAPPDKQLRSAFSRPSLDGVLAFRTHVDEAMENSSQVAFMTT
jgi:hypothetical protein